MNQAKTKYGINIPYGWSLVKLGELFTEKKILSSDLETYPLYSFTIEKGVCPKPERYKREHLLKDSSENLYRIIHKNDFIFNPMNLRFGAIGRSDIDFPVAVSAYYNILELKNINSGIYLENYLKSYPIINIFDRVSIGSLEEKKRVHLSMFSEIEIPLPPEKERSKIGEILSIWSKGINLFENILKNQELKRRGIEQQLLNGQIRLKGFAQSEEIINTKFGEIPSDWDLKLVSDLVQKVKKPFSPDPETLYREIGIRSHCKGIFHKEEVTGASLGNKSVFWIQPDCFVVNIVFAWEHAIAKTTEAEVGMIASHRFPMYKPKKGVLDLDFLLYYFKTARGKHLLGLASPGGAGRNKTLGQGEFAKLKIPVPSLAEQKRIVAVLSEADREIELLKQQIVTLKEQKKGLMQKLLTGEIRVNVK